MTDVAPPETSRIYMIASAPHIIGRFPPAPNPSTVFLGQASMNTLVYAPVIRALFDALDAWVIDGRAPPPSAYPRLTDGTLTSPADAGLAGGTEQRTAARAVDGPPTRFRARLDVWHRLPRTAAHRRTVRPARTGRRRGRKRPRRDPDAGNRGAAGDPDRLELPALQHRRAGSAVERDRLVLSARADAGRA